MTKNTIYLLLILGSITLSSFAQIRQFSNTFYIISEHKTVDDVDKNFRYTVDLKSVPSDTISSIKIQATQIGKDDYDYVQNNFSTKVATDTLWHPFVATGKITDKTKKIWLYVVQQGNGSFYIDNLKFEIQQDDGSWTNISIKNGDFEQTGNTPLKDFIATKKLPNSTTVTIVNRKDQENGKALLINATGGEFTWYTPYGNNKSVGKFCLVNGIKLYYETYGEGEPLLLLHGNGQSIASFAQQIPALAKKYKVIAVDTRAQGNSKDTGNTKLSYTIFAEDMKVLLDSLHLRKVNVLGWSDGGNTALIMSIKYPAYVNKVMVMGANLNPSTAAVEESILKQTVRDLKKLEQDPTMETKNISRLLTMMLTEPNIAVDDLHQITAKVLVMAGEKDLIKPQHTKLIADNIKGALLIIFKGETHFVPEKNPILFNETILKFLNE